MLWLPKYRGMKSFFNYFRALCCDAVFEYSAP